MNNIYFLMCAISTIFIHACIAEMLCEYSIGRLIDDEEDDERWELFEILIKSLSKEELKLWTSKK